MRERKKKCPHIANQNPSPSTRFKKGQSGNPGGLKKGVVPKAVLKQWTRLSVAEAYNKYMMMTIPELRRASDSLFLPSLEVVVARAIIRDRLEGELDNMERILDRAIGKVPQRQELGGIDGVPLLPPSIIFQGCDPTPNKEGK